MAQMSLIVTPTFEAALERLMRRRGFASRSDAVRTIVEEAAGAEETPEEIRVARAAGIARALGAWKDKGPDLPRNDDGSVDWGALKDEIHRGMP